MLSALLLVLTVPGPIVRTAAGPIMGASEGGLNIFRGIPYAAPSVGPNRWRPPQPVEKWQAVRSCTAFGPACPQFSAAEPRPSGRTSEDCLTLNVWGQPGRQGLPVIVFIHGGGLSQGASSMPEYSGEGLARLGAVFVSMNYRLGQLGFFAHRALSDEQVGSSGSYGLMDQIAALKWVKQNVRQFGGDPKRVTLVGHGSGTLCVSALMISTEARNLFHRAVMLSGGSGPTVRELRAASQVGQQMAEGWGAKDRTVEALRAIPLEKLMPLDMPKALLPSSGSRNLLVQDNLIIRQSPREGFFSGNSEHIPLLIGTAEHEGADFAETLSDPARTWDAMVPAIFPDVQRDARTVYGASPRQALTAFYTDLSVFAVRATARYHLRNGPVYMYEALGARHGEDLPGWLNLNSGESEMAHRLLQFAQTGAPNGPGLTPWPKFDAIREDYLALGRTAEPRRLLRSDAMLLLNGMRPRVR